jgi:hypothetical protein
MSFSRFSVSALWVVVVSIGASACGSATSPIPLAARYDLVSYEGQALPVETRAIVELSTQPGGPSSRCGDRLTAMNLRFVTSTSFTQTESRLLVCDDGRPDIPSSDQLNGTYQVSGGTLELVVDLSGGYSYHGFARFSDGALTIYRREVRSGAALSTVTEAPLGFVAAP